VRRAIHVGILAAALLVPAARARAAQGTLPFTILRSAQTVHRLVALTFDDGPSPYTPAVLAILQRYHVPATFFVVGEHAAQYPQFVRAEAAAGEDIGNHTYNHVDLEWLANLGVTGQIEATQHAVWEAAHVRPIWLRPPYGAVDPRITADAARLGLHTVLWSVDPRDWSEPGVPAITARVLSGVRPGSIVILHDGGGNREETVQALPGIIRSLLRRGYRFISLDEMFYPGVRNLPDTLTVRG
jgi:peptidoglycan/xylan/chitin deacetylase (PgdA/CDA1 family)